jgi:hypothetical protein
MSPFDDGLETMEEINISTQTIPAAGGLRLPLAPGADAKASRIGLLQRVCSFPAMLASLLVGTVACYARLFIVDPDLWWHVKVGETILATRHWPTTDIYSFTVPGQPWLAYEWLGDLVLAAGYRLGGVRGLEVLMILLGSAVMLALYGLATVRSGNSKVGFVTSIVLFLLASVSFTLRPQMLGYLFLVLTLIALERFRQGKTRALWFLPPLFLLWVNTHGSWIIGLGTIFAYWMSGLFEFEIGSLKAKRWTETERRSISFAFLLCLAMLPITPYGTRVAASPFEFALSLPLNVQYITEWQSMPFAIPAGKLFLFSILALILAQVMGRFAWRLEEMALFLFGTMMACLHVRFLLIFVPFFVAAFSSILTRWIPTYKPQKDKFVLNALIMACVAAGIIHYLPTAGQLNQTVSKSFPMGAVDYLKKNPLPGPMYNNYGFGGYLVWSRGPEQKVFIDGRGDVYERGGVLGDYLHISWLQPGALAVLEQYGVRSCLLKRAEPLATVLAASPDWKRIYTDDVSALFVRTEPWKR